jgi:hypothetical protein
MHGLCCGVHRLVFDAGDEIPHQPKIHLAAPNPSPRRYDAG